MKTDEWHYSVTEGIRLGDCIIEFYLADKHGIREDGGPPRFASWRNGISGWTLQIYENPLTPTQIKVYSGVSAWDCWRKAAEAAATLYSIPEGLI